MLGIVRDEAIERGILEEDKNLVAAGGQKQEQHKGKEGTVEVDKGEGVGEVLSVREREVSEELDGGKIRGEEGRSTSGGGRRLGCGR